MKLAVALLCYRLGDLWSRTFLRLGWGYRIYSRLMEWSLRFDPENKIWKEV